MDSVRSFFKEKLLLDLSTEKTRIVSLEEGFDFLGFRVQRTQLDRIRCVRIRPTQRNLSRLKNKLQSMLGPAARCDDPHMKIAALNRVLRGWANYYKAVNSFQQFRVGDFLAERLFSQWYRTKYRISVRRYLKEVLRDGNVVLERGSVKAELYRMTSNKSMRTSLNPKLVWKYRSIRNPYINSFSSITSVSNERDDPVGDIPNILPIRPAYRDEIYLTNRILAFERDGWKCTTCGSRDNLQAHHIEPIPKGVFDPMFMHRIENLRTLCSTCHARLPKER
jgi:RNA-directed DNA polymerase